LKRYCIDTSGLTHVWRDFYPPDIFPSLWKDIEDCISDGILIAPDEVLEELKAGGDDLYDWARRTPALFVRHDVNIQSVVSSILAHPEHAKLLYSKHATIAANADPFVIATAQVHDCTVVSNEKVLLSPSPNINKIPNVCADLGIEHLSVLEFIREQGWHY
jgi:hypothetical protein